MWKKKKSLKATTREWTGHPRIILRTLVFGRERRIDEDEDDEEEKIGERLLNGARGEDEDYCRIIITNRGANLIISMDSILAVSRGRDEGKFAENPRESKSLQKKLEKERKEESEHEEYT